MIKEEQLKKRGSKLDKKNNLNKILKDKIKKNKQIKNRADSGHLLACAYFLFLLLFLFVKRLICS
jgi:hypothetical protein